MMLSRPRIWPLVTVFVSILAMAVTTMLYANYTAHETGRKFCGSIGIVVNAYQDPANDPKTDVGRKFKDSYIKLYNDLGCK